MDESTGFISTLEIEHPRLQEPITIMTRQVRIMGMYIIGIDNDGLSNILALELCGIANTEKKATNILKSKILETLFQKGKETSSQ